MKPRLPALLLVPLLAGLAVLGLAQGSDKGADRAAPAGEREIRALLDEAMRITDLALVRSDSEAVRSARNGRLSGSLEGLGIFLREGDFFEWEGAPFSVPAELRSAESTCWILLRTGIQVRLLTVSAPDSTGRRASGTFRLDDDVDWIASGEEPVRKNSGVRLIQVDGRPVAWIPAGNGNLGASLKTLGVAALWFVLIVFLSLLVGWRRVADSKDGLWGFLLGLGAARLVLPVLRIPALLLPSSIGSPRVYGADGWFGLFGSPADLLLTTFTLWLACRLLMKQPRSIAFPTLAFLLSGFFLRKAALSLAVNSTLPILDLGDFPGPPARITLLAALGLAVAISAESLAAATTAWATLFRSGGKRQSGSGGLRRRTAAIFLMAFLAAAWMFGKQEKVGLERLRGEYAPMITEQESRRLIALRSALRRASSDPLAIRTAAENEDAGDAAAARIWLMGDLFEGGFSSSLTVYTLDGIPRSHFGFGLPLLEENPAEDAPDLPADGISRERVEQAGTIGSLPGELLHGQAPLFSGQQQVGWVVAHIVDEPNALPFLPETRFYLEALAPGRSAAFENRAYPEPDYALYDSSGIVLFSSLIQPPAWRVEYDKAALQQTPVQVVERGARYHAYPLLHRDKLHLLLLPQRSTLTFAGGAVRLALTAALLLLLLKTDGPFKFFSALRDLPGIVQRSFHRKLMTTLLLVSVIPLIVLALFLQRTIQRRMDAALLDTATRYGAVARRVVEDYGRTQVSEDPGDEPIFDDNLLFWLKRVVGQDIHLFEDGLLTATSRRELFTSGLLAPRLPGAIYRELLQENKPARVLPARLGNRNIPVAYAPVRLADSSRHLVVAVPLLYPQREIRKAVDRVVELLLLTTVGLVGLLAVAVTFTAGKVAKPVGEMVAAADRIADGSYNTRLTPRTRDELAVLVHRFNSMATSLESQRSSLTRRKEYIEALLRYATAGVVSTDPEGNVVTINPAARRLLELEEDEPVNGAPLADLVGRTQRLAPLRDVLARPENGSDPQEIDLDPGEKNDTFHRLRLVHVFLPDPSGNRPGSLYLMDDVTDMMRSSQLEAWAEMARAIAHEIKNPLTPIQLSAEHLERLLRDRGILPDDALESCLHTVKKQVRTLREIARGFSTYAKIPSIRPEPIDPAVFMKNTLEPYRISPPPGIRIVESYEPAPPISIDVRVMARAVVNLVENALQSMAGPGAVEGEPGEPRGTLTAAVDFDGKRGNVRLTIGDTGTGLSEEARKRLFEPYFSTKSSGTGLGLAIVKQSVQAHGGGIEVESDPATGTVFHILIPLGAGDPPPEVG